MKRRKETDEDFLWYVEHPEAFENYKGQHVAIWNKKIIGHGDTAKQAYDMAKKENPNSKPTLAFIPPEKKSSSYDLALFSYKHIQTETFGKVTVPVAKIFLQGQRQETTIDVIVDTGALISIFPRSLCDILGLDYEKGQQSYVKTATGENIPIRIHKLRIE